MLKNISLKDFKVSRLKYLADVKNSERDTSFFEDKIIFYFTDGTPPKEFDFQGGVCKCFQRGTVTIFVNRHSETIFSLYAYQFKESDKKIGNLGFSLFTDSYPIGLFEQDNIIGLFDILISYEFREIEYSKAHKQYVDIMKRVYNSANDVFQTKMFF